MILSEPSVSIRAKLVRNVSFLVGLVGEAG